MHDCETLAGEFVRLEHSVNEIRNQGHPEGGISSILGCKQNEQQHLQQSGGEGENDTEIYHSEISFCLLILSLTHHTTQPNLANRGVWEGGRVTSSYSLPSSFPQTHRFNSTV